MEVGDILGAKNQSKQKELRHQTSCHKTIDALKFTSSSQNKGQLNRDFNSHKTVENPSIMGCHINFKVVGHTFM